MTAETCCGKRQLCGDLSGKEMKDGDRNIVMVTEIKSCLLGGSFCSQLKKTNLQGPKN